MHINLQVQRLEGDNLDEVNPKHLEKFLNSGGKRATGLLRFAMKKLIKHTFGPLTVLSTFIYI